MRGKICPYGAHEKRDPRRISRLGRRHLERVSGLGHRVSVSAPLEGLLDTSAFATTWFVLGAVLGQGAEAAEDIQNQWIGLLGLVALAAGTAVEAGLAAKKSREQN